MDYLYYVYHLFISYLYPLTCNIHVRFLGYVVTVLQLPRMQCVDSRLDHDLKLVEIRYRHLSQNQAGLQSVVVDSELVLSSVDKSLRFGSLGTL